MQKWTCPHTRLIPSNQPAASRLYVQSRAVPKLKIQGKEIPSMKRAAANNKSPDKNNSYALLFLGILSLASLGLAFISYDLVTVGFAFSFIFSVADIFLFVLSWRKHEVESWGYLGLILGVIPLWLTIYPVIFGTVFWVIGATPPGSISMGCPNCPYGNPANQPSYRQDAANVANKNALMALLNTRISDYSGNYIDFSYTEERYGSAFISRYDSTQNAYSEVKNGQITNYSSYTFSDQYSYSGTSSKWNSSITYSPKDGMTCAVYDNITQCPSTYKPSNLDLDTKNTILGFITKYPAENIFTKNPGNQISNELDGLQNSAELTSTINQKHLQDECFYVIDSINAGQGYTSTPPQIYCFDSQSFITFALWSVKSVSVGGEPSGPTINADRIEKICPNCTYTIADNQQSQRQIFPPAETQGGCYNSDLVNCPSRCEILTRCDGTKFCSEKADTINSSDCGNYYGYSGSKACCAGLEKRCGVVRNGLCNKTEGLVGGVPTCVPCGNGICDFPYENSCNCPEDCK